MAVIDAPNDAALRSGVLPFEADLVSKHAPASMSCLTRSERLCMAARCSGDTGEVGRVTLGSAPRCNAAATASPDLLATALNRPSSDESSSFRLEPVSYESQRMISM